MLILTANRSSKDSKKKILSYSCNGLCCTEFLTHITIPEVNREALEYISIKAIHSLGAFSVLTGGEVQDFYSDVHGRFLQHINASSNNVQLSTVISSKTLKKFQKGGESGRKSN